ncbi:acyltransferase family protein [Streptomyces sp. NPDC047000]|uniref:acyltransferase family protein n=1 Tax=Streptomyces sp. NPDC047000 TaxID=3155474 RepID=UPI0033FE82CC
MFEPDTPPVQHRRSLPPAEPPSGATPAARVTPGASRSGDRPQGDPVKARDAFFDNAKYLAILLVAMGHSWEPLKDDNRLLQSLYLVVYTFHMPAFIIISGYFSRSFDMRPDRLKRLVTGVVVPYIVFETAYPLFKRFVGDAPDQTISLLDPWYLTWFLCALFIWRLTAPLWKLVRAPLPLALAIAMIASATPEIGNDLDLQRVLQFLPFFVLGLSLKAEHFHRVRGRATRILAVPVFAAAVAVGWWLAPGVDQAWTYRRGSAQELGAPWWAGPVVTLALFGCALLLTACFYAWVPRRTMWFTALGTGTLYAYLLHGFLIKGGIYGHWFDHPWLHGALGVVFVSALAATVATLLCTRPVRRMFRCVTEPEMAWAFTPDPAELARDREQKREREQAHERGRQREREQAQGRAQDGERSRERAAVGS